jgi:hypothetical protein
MKRVNYTPELCEKIEILWLEGATTRQITDATGVSEQSLEWQRRKGGRLAKLPKRGRGTGGGRRSEPIVDPTPEQIWGPLTAEIRSTWSDDDFYERRTGITPE